MLKALIILALVCAIWRWALGAWPWEHMLARPSRSSELERARRLLGVRKLATHRDVREAHRRMAATLHPDRGGSDAKLAEINAARDLLLAQLPKEPPESPEP